MAYQQQQKPKQFSTGGFVVMMIGMFIIGGLFMGFLVSGLAVLIAAPIVWSMQKKKVQQQQQNAGQPA